MSTYPRTDVLRLRDRELVQGMHCTGVIKTFGGKIPRVDAVHSTGVTKLIGLVGGQSARQVESDSDELSSKDGR